MQVDWELSKSWSSLDGRGIRCACVLPANTNQQKDDNDDVKDSFRVLVGTQGGGLVEFGFPSGHITPVSYQHDHSVTALTSLDTSSLYVTGCKDAVVRIFDSSTHELKGTLTGHDKPVTSLSWCNGYLISGSWDGTAKVWDIVQQCLVATLPNHENSVTVAGFESSSSSGTNYIKIATGSAGIAQNSVISGHTVRLWSVDVKTGETQLLKSVANDHEGPIRGICIHNDQLATCSNDGTVKVRSIDTATCTSTLTFLAAENSNTQHPPMLLGVTYLTDTDDAMLAACAEDGHVIIWDHGPQILLHASTVWNVLALPSSDLLTCCDDGVARIFTRATERMAPPAEREAFIEQVTQARQKTSGGPSAEEVAKLTPWETSAGMQGTSEGQVHLFRKDNVAIAAQWSMVSQTWIEVGQVMGSTDKDQIDGVTYDHVLPIEVDQTGGGVAELKIGYNNGENTFTAAQRFIDAHMLPQHHLSEIADYIQQRVGQGAPTLGGGTAAATPSSATTGVPIAAFIHLPAKAYKSFDSAEASVLQKMKTKMQEHGSLTDDQWVHMDALMATLAATNRYHASKVSDAQLGVLTDMLQRLEPAQAFPALDLARMAILHPDASTQTAYWSRCLTLALAMPTTDGSAVPMLTLRLVANAFCGGPGSRQAVVASLDKVLMYAHSFVASGNKNIRLSVATVLYNVCMYLQSSPGAVHYHKILPIVNAILTNKTYEAEAVLRTLVAVGTLIMKNPHAKEAANKLFLLSKVEPAASPHGATVKEAAKEVYAVLV
jgi:phospholipase A-2-activating protein